MEHQPGLVLPCAHAAIVLTDELDHYARLKLFLLNDGHTFLAERWLRDGLAADLTVAQAMHDAALRRELEALWAEEIVPVFDAIGKRDAAEEYLASPRERLENPFLAHHLADIARNHGEKKQRRFGPVVFLATQHGPMLRQSRLRVALAIDLLHSIVFFWWSWGQWK